MYLDDMKEKEDRLTKILGPDYLSSLQWDTEKLHYIVTIFDNKEGAPYYVE